MWYIVEQTKYGKWSVWSALNAEDYTHRCRESCNFEWDLQTVEHCKEYAMEAEGSKSVQVFESAQEILDAPDFPSSVWEKLRQMMIDNGEAEVLYQVMDSFFVVYSTLIESHAYDYIDENEDGRDLTVIPKLVLKVQHTHNESEFVKDKQ